VYECSDVLIVCGGCRRAMCGGMAYLKHADAVVFRRRELRSSVDWTVRLPAFTTVTSVGWF